ncbi:MAG: glycosyltransferase family 9 protein [bacterium]
MADPLFSRPWWRAAGFRVLGGILKPHRNQWAPLPKNPRRILVLLPVLRGDYLVATPLIEALSHARPRAEIAVVVTLASYDLAVVDPYVDRVILYEKLPWWPRSIWHILRYHPDIVVLPKGHPATTESGLVALSGAPFRVGLSHPHHDALLTHPIAHDWDNEHRTEAFARLLQPFGLDPAEVTRRLHIGVDPNAEIWAEKVIAAAPPAMPRIAVNISAGQPSRIWPAKNWSKLFSLLLNLYPEAGFVVLAAPSDRSLGEQLAQRVPQASTYTTNTILEASALLSRCTLEITCDTGMVHVASARNVPQVVLYNGDHDQYTRFSPQAVSNRCLLASPGESVAAHTPEAVAEAVHGLMKEINQE